ncbi:hypothetical protein PtA15_15A379 [Puccinia triticina]|uniref:Uncharacterized protein n=1 Tax=Puccinia triticina TaxID=208348 RepID=A0ABY7D314_9BASI|nr:uncharacterized protein PtA15_15A379 [Puccinia triticina]WAQ91986.1 hypothetical protein PtA15_15A379 [Puccinia triticina]WAR62790.1 hypothetical protein PtB15_15B378 [Puccinia triticina]
MGQAGKAKTLQTSPGQPSSVPTRKYATLPLASLHQAAMSQPAAPFIQPARFSAPAGESVLPVQRKTYWITTTTVQPHTQPMPSQRRTELLGFPSCPQKSPSLSPSQQQKNTRPLLSLSTTRGWAA